MILGSTGSVGTQAVDIVRRNPDRFRVVALAAGGSRPDLLADQAVALGVEAVAVADTAAAEATRACLSDRGSTAKLLLGSSGVAEVATWPCSVVLNAITGALGLESTLAAVNAGRLLALANKESLIIGGPLVRAAAEPGQIVPVDSEHFALAQCFPRVEFSGLRSLAQGIVGAQTAELSRLVITASGGPFRGWSRGDLAGVTPEQALAHPTWSMGPMITVNSATLVNKGLEVIEAHLLFDVPFEQIRVVVHPQSVIHSMVELVDGTTLAQASPPDMRLPIANGIGWPHRVPGASTPVDWTSAHTWTFEPLDPRAFPAVELAATVGATGGTAPAVYNAANEEAVAAFLEHRLAFPAIVDTVAQVVSEHSGAAQDTGLPAVYAADAWARARARELITRAG
ncbi:1-deoxy-D-xylulose-5-phosphate reductoisomerase [Lipingzhangella sp. LS1_29]|uniref:1-deoxy-D-xylulose 5-phosphate reductoisomerase n=1 Tax=Lipingzhangella rawalii TaxID=2055835 RepID=A0ABU2HAZ1_9ACTN|nr:1-deoxy-D-xylulose-5-phosphate reductoisomerase [Lipingzhangella rawalii]MDS1272497.1 1-deoxy-D-xylulose-5-phosphate reductoisomerase [Lipingzhangella rawalii]